jgi:hypothetical protein
MPNRSVLVAAVAIAWLMAPARAVADCEPVGPVAEVLPDAEIAFVGTVTDVRGSVAILSVREIWAGQVTDVVEVRGLGDEGRGPVVELVEGPSEDDRSWTPGVTYLVLPMVLGLAEDAVLRDHLCSATTEWTEELARLRPADARFVTSETETSGPSLPVLLIGLVASAIVGASWLAFRRRSA